MRTPPSKLEQDVEALCKEEGYEMLTTSQWKARSEPHPYPEISINPRVRTHRVIPCQVGHIGMPYCWVDAGTASQFSGDFPMTAVDVIPPPTITGSEGLAYVGARMKRLMTFAAGERRSRRIVNAYAYPHFTEDNESRLTLMALYVGYESTVQVVREVFVP